MVSFSSSPSGPSHDPFAITPPYHHWIGPVILVLLGSWVLDGMLGGEGFSNGGDGGTTMKSTATLSRGYVLVVMDDFVVPAYTAMVIVLLNVLSYRQFLEEKNQWTSEFKKRQQEEEEYKDVLFGPWFHNFLKLFGMERMMKKKRRVEPTSSTSVDVMPPSELQAALATPAVTSSSSQECIDMTGSYKLERKENFQEFLACQGVPWAIRKAADRAPAINHLTHRRPPIAEGELHTLSIRVQGIITSETTYIINGPPIETRIQSKIFHDSMTYLPSGRGVQVEKVCKEEGYKIVVQRSISDCNKAMNITSTVVFQDGSGRESVTSTQYFRRIESDEA